MREVATQHNPARPEQRATQARGERTRPLRKATNVAAGSVAATQLRAPFLSHGQPVRRRRVVERVKISQFQPRCRTGAPSNAFCLPHLSMPKRQRNPAWRQWHAIQDRSAEQREWPQLLFSKVQRQAQSGEQNRKAMLWRPRQGAPAEITYRYEVNTRDRKLAGRSAHSAKKCEGQHPKFRKWVLSVFRPSRVGSCPVKANNKIARSSDTERSETLLARTIR